MKLLYKSSSFEVYMEYEDSAISASKWLETYDARLQVLLKLTKEDAEAMTRYQCAINAAKSKEIGQ